MAKNNLAGLAALGALGMMMSKGKKGSDTSGMDTEGFEGIKNLPRRDTGMSEKEPGGPDFGSEKEPDENYRYSGTRTSPTARPTASRARATAPSSRSTISADAEAGMTRGTRPRDARDAEAGMSRGTRSTSMAGAGRGMVNPASVSPTPDMSAYVPRRTPQANSTTEEGMRNYVSRAPTGMERDTSEIDRVRNLAGAFNVPMRPRGSEDDFKKGGAVKKMAKGGLASSASRRADGIASKGKTRGKIC